jgi:hypothetical protein
MDFGDALLAMHKGRKIRRKAWDGVEGYLHIKNPEAEDKERSSYRIYAIVFSKSTEWVPDQASILATDWEMLK